MNRPRARLLVVDDDPDLRASLVEALSAEGFGVESADDGLAALERLRRLPQPELVVLDLVMPHLGGAALLDELRRTPRLKRMAVVAISSDGTRLGEVRGADALLPKPFALHALVDVIDRVLVRGA